MIKRIKKHLLRGSMFVSSTALLLAANTEDFDLSKVTDEVEKGSQQIFGLLSVIAIIIGVIVLGWGGIKLGFAIYQRDASEVPTAGSIILGGIVIGAVGVALKAIV